MKQLIINIILKYLNLLDSLINLIVKLLCLGLDFGILNKEDCFILSNSYQLVKILNNSNFNITSSVYFNII